MESFCCVRVAHATRLSHVTLPHFHFGFENFNSPVHINQACKFGDYITILCTSCPQPGRKTTSPMGDSFQAAWSVAHTCSGVLLIHESLLGPDIAMLRRAWRRRPSAWPCKWALSSHERAMNLTTLYHGDRDQFQTTNTMQKISESTYQLARSFPSDTQEGCPPFCQHGCIVCQTWSTHATPLPPPLDVRTKYVPVYSRWPE